MKRGLFTWVFALLLAGLILPRLPLAEPVPSIGYAQSYPYPTPTPTPNLTPPAPVPNDTWADAQVIVEQALPFSFSETRDVRGAVREGDEPCDGGQSMWYSFSPTAEMCVTVGTANSSYCTYLGVYTGSPGGFEQVAGCTWGCPWDGGSRVSFKAKAGISYYILVTAPYWDGASLTLKLDASPAPSNDDIGTAKVIPSLPYNDALDTSCATWDDPVGAGWCYGGRNVWYALTVPEDLLIRASIEGSSPWGAIDVYAGVPGSLTWVTCGSPVAEFRAEGGAPYYLMATGDIYSLQIAVNGYEPPPNDEPANASVIAEMPFTDEQNLTAAVWEEPGAGYCYSGRSVWYSFTMPESRYVRLSTEGSSCWVAINLYSGSPGALTYITCGYPLDFLANAGTQYYVMVVGDPCQVRFSATELGPPLDIRGKPVSGTVNPRTGAATIGGVVTCNQPVDVYISGELRQKLGRTKIITAWFETSCRCDGQGRWTATVRSNQGAYGGGNAEVVGRASGCALGCDEQQITQVIKLKGGGR